MTTIDWAACERLIGSLASKFHQDGLDLNDLRQEANLAVLESYADYTPETGVSLNTYLGRRIRDALRTFVSKNTDLLEVSREWIAEPIADDPRNAIKAKSKEECQALVNALGPDAYKKPRRVIETISVAVSFDADDGDASEDALSLHERVGTGPEQELGMLAAEMSAKVKTKLARNGSELAEIFRLRSEGRTFPQIAEMIGKDADSVRMAFSRAQKRLAKKAA